MGSCLSQGKQQATWEFAGSHGRYQRSLSEGERGGVASGGFLHAFYFFLLTHFSHWLLCKSASMICVWKNVSIFGMRTSHGIIVSLLLVPVFKCEKI